MMNRERAMGDQLKKGQMRRKRIVYLIMGTFLIWAAYTWYQQMGIIDAKHEELQTVKAELEKTEKTKADLEYKVQRLNDPEYIANYARSNFYLSKKGEIIFEVITEPSENQE